MANTLISYDGLPTYYNNTNMRNISLYTNASAIYLNKNCGETFYTGYGGAGNNAYISLNTLKRFRFDFVENAYSMFKNVFFQKDGEYTLKFPNIIRAPYMFTETNFNYMIELGNNCNNTMQMFYNDQYFNQNIVIPQNVENALGMFQFCYNLDQNIHIPDKTYYTMYMFANCTNLRHFGGGNNVTYCEEMFRNCVNLIENYCYFPKANWANNIFQDCIRLNNVNYIFGDYSVGSTNMMSAFYNCVNLSGNLTFQFNALRVGGIINGRSPAARLNIFSKNISPFIANGVNSIFGTNNNTAWVTNTSNHCTYNTLKNVYIYNQW